MSVVPSVDEIAWLRDNSPAWRLLRADNAPLVLSFLHRVFVADNVRSISATELASRLDDELYALNQQDGGRAAPRFPKPAKAYLDDWAAPGAGWLRKYYPEAPTSRITMPRPRSRRRCSGWTACASASSWAPSRGCR
jgi:Protein of unknown function (DUF3375)